MGRIVLISCASKKLDKRAKARDMYTSTLFRYSLEYAEKLRPKSIFILSAKYGLLPLNKRIKPYDQTLNTMSAKEIRAWSETVLSQLRKKANIKKDHFIFLAGSRYRKYLIPHMSSYEVPMEGKRIGEQLQFLKREIS